MRFEDAFSSVRDVVPCNSFGGKASILFDARLSDSKFGKLSNVDGRTTDKWFSLRFRVLRLVSELNPASGSAEMEQFSRLSCTRADSP